VSRNKVVCVAGLLCGLAIVLPVVISLYIAWDTAVVKEQERLSLVATRAIARTESTFRQVEEALAAASALPSRPCSAEHIDGMRRISVQTRPVTEMGYFADGALQCTSWGAAGGSTAEWKVGYVTDRGVRVVPNKRAYGAPTVSMLGLQNANYCVLVDPVWLVDVTVRSTVQLALVARNGAVLATLNHPDPAAVDRIFRLGKSGIDGRHVAAVATSGDWVAIVLSPRQEFSASVRREQMVLLPGALLAMTSMIGLIVWLSRRRLSLKGELATAVRKREFVVHYQPLIELATGICVGAEALVRWRRPDGTLVRPDVFIPVAEENGLIGDITDQVVAGVVADLGAALRADRSLHVAINLVADDLQSGRVLRVIQRAIGPAGVRTEQIWLEATERGFLDPEVANVTINEARRLGHSIAIDDFGTGYSSLQYLESLHVDTLKIDKSFIDTVGTDSATSSITPHIIEMGKSLGLILVAEGIERPEQADYLIALGVQYGQGWYYAPALPAREFIAFYEDCRARHGSGPEVISRY